MPKLTKRVPSYRHHKQTGQASRKEYERLVGEWLTHERRLPPSQGGPADLTINELLVAFLSYAKEYYRDPYGNPTAEVECMKLAMRPLRQRYGHTSGRSR